MKSQLAWVVQGGRGKLSQDLVALWVDEYGPALALMRRIFPPGLMRYLNVRKPAPVTPQLVNASQPLQVSSTCCTSHVLALKLVYEPASC